jgi:hypothetical protein
MPSIILGDEMHFAKDVIKVIIYCKQYNRKKSPARVKDVMV